jgi:hypothetical protein
VDSKVELLVSVGSEFGSIFVAELVGSDVGLTVDGEVVG